MTTRRHSDTAPPASGLDAVMEDAFAWVQDNARIILIGLVAIFGVGLVIAAVYESRRSSLEEARAALSAVESTFAEDMGAIPGEAAFQEPANPERGRSARETALAGYLDVVEAYGDTRSGELARMRAAEVQVDLGDSEAARETLAALVQDLPADDALRGVALRLSGFVHEQQGDFVSAGEAYLAAAEVDGYPVSGLALVDAGSAFARAGETERALAAFTEAVERDAEYAERAGLIERIEQLEASRPAPAASAELAPEPNAPTTSESQAP